MEFLAQPGTWVVPLLTLTLLEIVLGIDNVIFISILAGKLPVPQQAKARNTGLLLAFAFGVEMLNLRIRGKAAKPVELRQSIK